MPHHCSIPIILHLMEIGNTHIWWYGCKCLKTVWGHEDILIVVFANLHGVDILTMDGLSFQHGNTGHGVCICQWVHVGSSNVYTIKRKKTSVINILLRYIYIYISYIYMI
jgi:hypothetical protein